MSNLSIIPARAVADSDLTDMQVRVLCAVGTFTNRLGGNVWASINTLAKHSNLSPRSVQRALPILVEKGYLRRVDRVGRTNLYEVILQTDAQGVTQESPGGDSTVRGGVTTQSPKRLKENDTFNELAGEFLRWAWNVYPQREEKPVYVVVLKSIIAALQGGATPDTLASGVAGYADHVARNKTEPKYIKSMHRFFLDGAWQAYAVQRVHGRTREEWARSGQDVAEFDNVVGAA